MNLSPVALTAPACAARQLTVSTDAQDGAFDGMSHSGTLLVVLNRSRRACSLPGLPTITLRDGRGRRLPITRRAPQGMHPGPVVRPVVLAPHAQASIALRWVSAPVYDNGRCYAVRAIAVTIAGATARSPLRAQVCGSGGAATFEQPALTTGG